jgi:hypothetical protein
MRPILPAALLLAMLVGGCGPKSYAPSAHAFQDADLAARAKTALLNSPEVNATRIDVKVANGVVTLEGVVSSEAEAQKATELVRQIKGVTGVNSKVRVAQSDFRLSTVGLSTVQMPTVWKPAST